MKWRIPILILYSSAILFIGLSKSALWDRDETEYAQAAIEMQTNHEWLIPTLEGRPFIEKPVFLYWAVRASYKIFGVNDFSARFPCALFGVLTVLATALLAQAIYSPAAGFWAGMSLASMFLFAGGFRLLLTDPFFVLFSTLTFLFYALSKKHKHNSISYLSAAYLAMGLGILSKGPIGIFPLCVILAFEWLDGEREISKHLSFSLLSAAVAAPWFLYSFSHAKSETSTFFVYDNLMRFFQSNEGHTGPFFYHALVLILGTLPWTFFLFKALRENWQNRLENRIPLQGWDFLLILWAGSIFLFFSVCVTKLPHYMFPALPPLACLLGSYISQNAEREKTSKKILIGTLIFFVSVTQFVLPQVEKQRVMKPMGLAIKEKVPPDAKLYGYYISEPSLFIYSGRIFPYVENESLDALMDQKEPVFAVIPLSRMLKLYPGSSFGPYPVIEIFSGFAENHGDLGGSLLLISNQKS